MKSKKLNWAGITWLILIVISIITFFVVTGFIIFPDKFVIPFAAILVLLIAIMGILVFRRVNKKKSKKIGVIVTNCILSVVLGSVSIYLPILQGQLKGLFKETGQTQEVRINAYVMTSEYKSAHNDVFANVNTSTELSDYMNARFLTQSKVDQDNQTYALEDIQKQMNVNELTIIQKDDVIGELSSLYDGTGDVMIMNEQYESTISEIAGYEHFSTDTQILYTVIKTIQVEQTAAPVQNLTNSSFMMFIAGSDTRGSELTMYTRTDVDLLLTVDPVNRQILLISLPRDWYVRNPALWNEYDKLTHLGNDGLDNTVEGLNQQFGFDYIKNYLEVNFVTFYNIVEAIGGVDINNPYAFTTDNGTGYVSNGYWNAGGDPYYFTEGQIHLDGNEALAYVRERYNLPNGDLGRNEHQSIVLAAIIQKLTSSEIIGSFNNLLNNLQGNFLTSVSADDIYSLAEMQLNKGGSWNMVSYHLGGVGDYNVTASMGSMELYVSYPIDTQVQFAKDQITKVMNGELITQGELPNEDQVEVLPN